MIKWLNNLFIIFFSSVFIGGIFYNQSQIKNADFLPLIIFFFLFLLIFVSLFKIYKKYVKEISLKSEIIIFSLISLIIISLLIIFGYYLRVNGGGWDLYVVIRAATNIANSNSMHIHDVIYYQAFSTNHFITILLSLVFRLFFNIGINNTLLIGISMNIFMIYISFVFMYFIIRKIYTKKVAIFMLASTIILTPLYLYAPIFYTDTFSLPFVMSSILIYLYLKEANSKYKKIILSILLGTSLFIGMKLKMTVLIVFSSMIFDLLLNKEVRDKFLYLIYTVITVILCFLFYNFIVNKSNIFPFDLNDNSKKVPYEHYIMMGLNIQNNYYDDGKTWYGVWNYNDYAYTLLGIEEGTGYLMSDLNLSKLTYIEKKENAISRYIEKVKEMGLFNYFKYLHLKSVFTFGDGTYYAPLKISLDVVEESIFDDYFRYYGDNFDLYFYVAQGIHFVILFFMIISAYLKKEDNLLFKLMLIQLFIFLLFWETRSRYVLNYSLVMYLMIIPTLDKLSNYKD